VDDVSVALEHVDLLDCLNWLNVHLLERRLQLLIVGASALVDLLDLSAGSAFATIIPLDLYHKRACTPWGSKARVSRRIVTATHVRLRGRGLRWTVVRGNLLTLQTHC
jgi:hypothetical protein